MVTEAQQLLREATRIVGGLMLACILMLALIAVVRDGAATGAIVAQLITAIQWGMPILGAVITVGQIASAYVTGRSIDTGRPIPVSHEHEHSSSASHVGAQKDDEAA